MKWQLAVLVLVVIGVGYFMMRGFLPTAQPGSTNGVEVSPTSEPTPIQSGTETTDQSTQIQPMTNKTFTAPPPVTINPSGTYTAVLTTDKGVMRIPLFANEAPKTVNNFIFLAKQGFYDTTIFHRVIKDFMIQGGDPEGSGRGGPGYQFADEPVTREYTRGTLAMANAGPNTNGSQFFIVHADVSLPKAYTIFGKIDDADSASFATLDAIASQDVQKALGGEMSQPVTPVTVQSIVIEE